MNVVIMLFRKNLKHLQKQKDKIDKLCFIVLLKNILVTTPDVVNYFMKTNKRLGKLFSLVEIKDNTI